MLWQHLFTSSVCLNIQFLAHLWGACALPMALSIPYINLWLINNIFTFFDFFSETSSKWHLHTLPEDYLSLVQRSLLIIVKLRPQTFWQNFEYGKIWFLLKRPLKISSLKLINRILRYCTQMCNLHILIRSLMDTFRF